MSDGKLEQHAGRGDRDNMHVHSCLQQIQYSIHHVPWTQVSIGLMKLGNSARLEANIR